MKETVCLALLRGINVGGKNIIKMDELKRLFEDMGFKNVTTYIQSGNVIFLVNDRVKLKDKIEKTLSYRLGNQISVAILTLSEFEELISQKPKGFGGDKKRYKYDAVFLIEPLQSKEALAQFEIKDGVDRVYDGKKAIYISRLISKLSKSCFPKIIKTTIYKNITIRSWNTVEKLHEIMKSQLKD